MKQDLSRIGNTSLTGNIMQACRAVSFIQDGTVVASSGFAKSGDSKAVLLALSERAEYDPLQITLITRASLGQQTDARLATAGAVSLRLPFHADPVMRTLINEGKLMYIDENLGETAMHLKPVYLAISTLRLLKHHRSKRTEVLYRPLPWVIPRFSPRWPSRLLLRSILPSLVISRVFTIFFFPENTPTKR